MKETYTYKIAELPLRISYTKGQENSSLLLPSFEPFCIDNQAIPENELLFHLDIDDDIRPMPKMERTRIRDVDTGNGVTIVDLLSDGGYQFIIKNIAGNSCCLLITDKDFCHCRCALNGTYGMRTFGLNNALMLIFAFAGTRYDLVLLHASLVRQNGFGYAFIAKSGTGKSTQVSMWLRYLPGCDLMNDDNPIVRIIDDKPIIFGSPWSGKTPCYRNVKAELGAITRIVRDETNFVESVSPIEAFASLLESVSSMKWDHAIFDRICKIISKLIEIVPNYNLHCLPNKEAALVCNKAISRSKKC